MDTGGATDTQQHGHWLCVDLLTLSIHRRLHSLAGLLQLRASVVETGSAQPVTVSLRGRAGRVEAR